MNIIGKSILRKILLYFVGFGVVLTLTIFYFFSGDHKNISISVFLLSLFIVLFFFLLVFLFEIARPIRLILKPMKELLTGKKYHRIYTDRIDEIGVIAHFFNEVTKSFEKVSLDINEGKRMLGELEVAGKIQKDILPPQCPKVPGLDIVAKTRPAVELGGDNFDFITVGNNTFIYVGDVTGHGVPAAIVMTMVNTLIHSFVEIFDNAYDVVVKTNKQIKSRIKSTMFMTMLMFRWNHEQQKMSYVGCGHEHVMVYRADKGKCDLYPTGGIALGMVPDNSQLIKETELKLEKGDVIILYTDGVTEGRNMMGELYGLDRLTRAVEKYAAEYGPDGIINYVGQDYARFVQDHIQDDDVTLIAIKYVGIGNENKSSDFINTTAWSSIFQSKNGP